MKKTLIALVLAVLAATALAGCKDFGRGWDNPPPPSPSGPCCFIVSVPAATASSS